MALTGKIILHIILDLTVIIVIIMGFYIIKLLLERLGMGNDTFISTLIMYSESAALLVYVSFALISIIGILKNEILVKIIKPLNKDQNGGV